MVPPDVPGMLLRKMKLKEEVKNLKRSSMMAGIESSKSEEIELS